MSTRSRIYVYGGADTANPFCANLYRHCDGYPSAQLATLAAAASTCKDKAKTFAQALLLAGEGVRLEVRPDIRLRALGAASDQLAAALESHLVGEFPDSRRSTEFASCAWIGGWAPDLKPHLVVRSSATVEEGNPTQGTEAPLKPWEHDEFPLGSKLDMRILGCQGDLEWVYFVDVDRKNINVYAGYGTPSELVAKGKADPMSQVDSVMPAYASAEAEAVLEAIRMVDKTGWTLNAQALGIEAECAADARKWKEAEQFQSELPKGRSLSGPEHVPASGGGDRRMDGPMLRVGEFWTLQRADFNGGHAYVIHDRKHLNAPALSEGMSYSIVYGALDSADVVPLAQARRAGPDPQQGLFR